MAHENPITDEEWRFAVTYARGALLLHAAQSYGLVTGGPAVNVDRCAEIIELGRSHGVEATDDDATRLILELHGGAKP